MIRTVNDVMTKRVVVVHGSAPFKEVVRTMEEHRVSALPVMDEGGRLLGIVSEADLLLKEEFDSEPERHPRLLDRRRTDRRKAAAVTAASLMTSPAVTVRPDATLAEAAHVMHDRGVKRLPVVDPSGRLVGIVSRADLLKVFLRPDDEIAREIRQDVILRTLWIEPTTIRVIVSQGVVRLRGRVERQSLIPLIVRMASEIEGVVDVQDELTAEFDDTALARGAVYTPWALVPPSPVGRNWTQSDETSDAR